MSSSFGPFKVYSLGPERWERTASSRCNRPRLPHGKRLNKYGPPPHGVAWRWLRFGLVVWFPRAWTVWRAR